MSTSITISKVAWSVQEVSEATGLSVPFLRREIKRGVLPVTSFGRRKLVRNSDLEKYLEVGSKGSKQDKEDSQAS